MRGNSTQLAHMIVLGVLFAVVLIFFVYINIRRIKEKRPDNTVVPQYDPPDNLPPLVLSKMLVESIASQEIVAEVLDLVLKKAIVLRSSTDGFGFELTRSADSVTLLQFEKGFLDALFGHRESISTGAALLDEDTQGRITSFVADYINKQIYPKYYTKWSVRLTAASAGLGLLCFVLAFGAFVFPPLFFAVPFCFIFLLSSNSWLRKNAAGNKLYEQTLGFKEYLKTAEADRIHFESGAQHSSGKLDKLLPYAIAFGLEQSWTQGFSEASPELYAAYMQRKKSNMV